MPAPPRFPGLPLLGNTLDFWRDPVDFFRRGYQRHGPVFTFRLAHRWGVALIGPTYHRLFFQQTDDVFSMQEAYRFIQPIFEEALLFVADPKEREEQQALYHSAFQGRRLHGYVREMVREVSDWLDTLGAEGEFEAVETFRSLATSVAARSLIGEAFLRRLGAQFGELFQHLMAGIDFVLPPRLPLPRFKRRDRAKAGLLAMLERIVAERRDAGEDHDDFLQAMIEAKTADGRPFPDRLIANRILELIWSGYETTAGTLAWSLILVLQHPEVEARLRREQEDLVDPERPLDLETISRLQELEMAVRETERFMPVVPLLMRYPVRDVEIDGYQVPRGCLAFVCPAVAHRLPEVFPEPEVYDPRRFAQDSYPPFSLIGFGGAHHRCLGFNFATNEIKVVLTSLLRRYELELVTPHPRPLTRPGTVRGPEPPCRVRYRRTQ